MDAPNARLLLLLLSCAVPLIAGCQASAPTPISALSDIPVVSLTSTPHPVSNLPESVVLSVLYFEDRAGSPHFTWLRKGLTDMLIADVAKIPALRVVQRERLEEILREQEIQASGRFSDATAVRIGHLAGATVLLSGTISMVGSILRFDAALVDVEHGTILGSATVEGRPRDILMMEKLLALRILALLGIPLTDEDTVRITRPNTNSLEATEANYRGVDAADNGEIEEALRYFQTAVRKDADYDVAQVNYQRLLRVVSGDDLWLSARRSIDQKSLERKIAQEVARQLFVRGFVIEIGEAEPEVTIGPPRSVVLNVPVRVSFDASPILHFLTATAQQLGERIEQTTSRLTIVLSADEETNSYFASLMRRTPRLFIRALNADGTDVWPRARLPGWNAGYSRWVVVTIRHEVVITTRRHLPTTAHFHINDLGELKKVAAIRGELQPKLYFPKPSRNPV